MAYVVMTPRHNLQEISEGAGGGEKLLENALEKGTRDGAAYAAHVADGLLAQRPRKDAPERVVEDVAAIDLPSVVTVTKSGE